MFNRRCVSDDPGECGGFVGGDGHRRIDGSQGWFQFDTRANGSATISTDQPRDGNASLKITTTGSTDNKADVAFGNGGSLGNLKDVDQLSADYYIPSGNTAGGDVGAMAVRLGLDDGSALVWEYASQTGTAIATNTWLDNIDMASQKFWYYNKATNTNNNAAGQYFTLSDWVNGTGGTTAIATSETLSASTVKYLHISFGSGITGNFTGYADDVRLGFNGGSSYASNFETATVTAVPAPNALAGGAALLMAFGAFRFFRSRVLA